MEIHNIVAAHAEVTFKQIKVLSTNQFWLAQSRHQSHPDQHAVWPPVCACSIGGNINLREAVNSLNYELKSRMK